MSSSVVPHSTHTTGICLTLTDIFTASIECRSSVAINVYPHFGERNMWPRGFPLDLIRKQKASNQFIRTEAKPLVLQVSPLHFNFYALAICFYKIANYDVYTNQLQALI